MTTSACFLGFLCTGCARLPRGAKEGLGVWAPGGVGHGFQGRPGAVLLTLGFSFLATQAPESAKQVVKPGPPDRVGGQNIRGPTYGLCQQLSGASVVWLRQESLGSRGAWMASDSIFARVMISQFVSSSLKLGSTLTSWSLLGFLSLSLSLSAPPPSLSLAVSLSVSQTNTLKK